MDNVNEAFWGREKWGVFLCRDRRLLLLLWLKKKKNGTQQNTRLFGKNYYASFEDNLVGLNDHLSGC